MLFGLLTLITALSISAVAIYYSVAGLVAIFAAAAVPIMIMGGVLEVAKLVTAVWLHKYWKQATWWLRTYLSTAVIVLMFITSMGIFGFLSKAHIEQTSASEESIARAEQMQKEIDRQIAIVGRAENRIRQLENSETGASANLQSQIDKEQERIDSAYSRIQPAIDEQNAIIKEQTNLYSSQIEVLDNDFNQLQAWINEGGKENIAKVQGMVGTKPDGSWGFLTSNAVDNWRNENRTKREELVTKVEEISQNNSTIKAARAEIQRLRRQAETQIAEANKVINRLRSQLGNTDNADQIQKDIDEQLAKVKDANNQIDTLTEEKYAIEAEYRKLEAEVGPIKYIAEFVYGDTADNNMLEEAVRWVIVTIIFVFDPLAVLLLLAAQYTFEFNRKIEPEDDNGGSLRPKDPEDPVLNERTENVPEPIITTDDPVGDNISKADTSVADVSDQPVEQLEIQVDEEEPVESKKKDPIESLEESQRRADYEEKEQTVHWQQAKKLWKEEHPEKTIKEYKRLYILGEIEHLPWEEYVTSTEDIEHHTYLMKEQEQQVTKTTKPDLPKSEDDARYIQNAEQTDNTLWKRMKDSGQ